MNEIEKQILKNQASIMNALVYFREVNENQLVSIRERMKETSDLLNPKGAEESACNMSETKFYKKGKDANSREEVKNG